MAMAEGSIATPVFLAANLAAVRSQIADAARAAGRNTDEIQLLAISKTQPLASIHAAIAAGQTCFGENYAQEALAKIHALAHVPLEWHFTGALQTNKTQVVANAFHWVHTVATLTQAQRLHRQRSQELPPLNICVQVNVSREPQKSGVDLCDLPALAAEVMALPRLRLRGLMTVPRPSNDFAQQRQPFSVLREAWQQLRAQGMALDTLSMGMSADLAAAIAEGATLVRIGTAIFGPRPAKALQ